LPAAVAPAAMVPAAQDAGLLARIEVLEAQVQRLQRHLGLEDGNAV
jgi:hypothetical protein